MKIIQTFITCNILVSVKQFIITTHHPQYFTATILEWKHIHLIWQVQDGNEREAVQRNFLKFVSQTIKRDLEKKYPKVLERFYVGAKDRAYQFWERNPLIIDLWIKEIFILGQVGFCAVDFVCLPMGLTYSVG